MHASGLIERWDGFRWIAEFGEKPYEWRPIETLEDIERRLRKEAMDRHHERKKAPDAYDPGMFMKLTNQYYDELGTVEERAKDELARQMLEAL